MLYLDDYYKIDCENKIKYDNLVEVPIVDGKFEVTDSVTNKVCGIYRISKLLTDQDEQNPIYLAVGEPGFYTKNLEFCKEIGPDLYKISIKAFKPSRNEANRQRRYIDYINN